MKPTTTLAALSLVLGTFTAATALAHEVASPNADQILRQMSATLAGAKQFTFKAHRKADAALTTGDARQDVRLEVAVARPNMILAKAVGGKGGKNLYADGRNVTLHDPKKNLYATVPMRTSIDGLVDRISERYGFTPPIAEFVLSDPYNKGFKQAAMKVAYVGRETRSGGFLRKGVQCDHLMLHGKAADAELWVGAADHLPRTLIATFKDRPGSPKLRIDFSDWNLSASTPPAAFTYVPSKGAMKIPMRTTAEIAAAARKGAKK